ncbi:MAG: type I-E CRISPR-associated protein Cas5/CasD [Pyrinomonadaceae bacterium]|nr:type I-E CRISPR-associated protein Cas5/CasD [Pyrinomonadaceae bacterium]
MKYTLLLRLKAPMQSWGVSSRFSIRDTGKEPSKSGVIGLLCAALGISRDEANLENEQFKKLTKLKMNIRVLREGVMQKDYHTAQNVAKAAGGTKPTELSDRWFLADADFLVGLESEDFSFLENLQNALKKPKWQLFLGRKAFVPSVPVYFRNGVLTNETDECFLKSKTVEKTLVEHDKDSNFQKPKYVGKQRLICEPKDGEDGAEVRQDVPLDFAKRLFSLRRVRTEFFTPVEISEGGKVNEGNLSDTNDA